MNRNIIESLRSDLTAKFPNVKFGFDFVTDANVVTMPKEYVFLVMKHLKDTGRFDF